MVRLAKGYSDLNIPWREDDGEGMCLMVKRASDLGYSTVALNVEVNQKDLRTKHQSRKRKADEDEGILDFPEPPKLGTSVEGVTILTRLTITVQDNSFIPIFNNSVHVKKYDLLSVIPESSLSLQNLIKSSFRADIISVNPERVNDVKWNRKLLSEIGAFSVLELLYAPCIRDSGDRRRFISLGHHLKTLRKSKRKILVSSGALRPIELRSPHDVANLTYIFGLNENKGRESVREMPQAAVRFGAGRRVGPFRALVRKESELTSEEKILLGSSSSSSDEDDNS